MDKCSKSRKNIKRKIAAICAAAMLAGTVSVSFSSCSGHDKNESSSSSENSTADRNNDADSEDENDEETSKDEEDDEDESNEQEDEKVKEKENKDKNTRPVINKNPGPLDTGNLSEDASKREGKKGTGDFNYGEALQKAVLFYDMQRSGKLPEKVRCNWRGDSGLNDGEEEGLDLTGGLYDAGDHVKFNLPMAYTGAMLAWTAYEDRENLEDCGQLDYLLDNIRWINDYLIKCHPEDDVYYYQVGDGSIDHAWWGPAEVMQMERPCFKVDSKNPGSTVSAEAAASLAACSVIFEKSDKSYSKECLSHAKSLFKFAEKTKSDDGYTAANGFYNSWSGFYDELGWAAAWLYIATGDKDYLKKSEEYTDQAVGNYKWAQCWDDVYIGTCLLLTQNSKDKKYCELLEKHLDFWTDGYEGERITYTPDGLAWLDQWGSLRYATTESFIAAMYSRSDKCTKSKRNKYWDFAVSQINYALGSTGRSFVVGFGEDPPQMPHHRTAHGSWSNNLNDPDYEAHTLYGALVGGPDSGGNYQDEITNYNLNEVACDYNAGFVGALAEMYGKYGGKTLVDFGAVEEPDRQELYVMACVNVDGNDFTEVKAMVYNQTAWPARVSDKLELRYFIDLSEIFEDGGSADNIAVTLNYSQEEVKADLVEWDSSRHIYYVSIDFAGAKIYPGGQEHFKKEVQFRIRNENGAWDTSNDFSFKDIAGTNGGSLETAEHFALYDDGNLVFGSEP